MSALAMKSRKLKIAFLVVKNIARGGGIEKYTQELGRRLVERGHDVTVYSMGHYGEVAAEFMGMRVIRVPCIRKAALEKLSASAAAALFLFLSHWDYDIVHCHSVAAGAFAPLIRLKGFKCILQMHGIEWQRNRWSAAGKNILKLLEKVSLAGNHACTAVSTTQCDYYREHHGIHMRYIPTGAELKPHHEACEILKMGLEPGRYILFASRLVREKGAHYLLEAYRGLKTEYRLVIAGDAKGEELYRQELQALAADDPRIMFPGFVEGRALQELFSNAAVYVQPSEIEGLSIALLEAMSFGNCCLVSDIPENMEAIGNAGFSFHNKSVASLQNELIRLIELKELRESVRDAARSRVRNSYNWDRIADDFEEMYRSLAG
jgi:glycosyltransferase involved in cell wall biosynthesis